MANRRLKYTTPASATNEGRERERLYFQALGRFTHTFARAESILTLAFWYYAKVPHKIARAVFSGVRVKDASAAIRRLIQVSPVTAEAKAELDDILGQMIAINDARNDILHYGATDIAEGKGAVTNELKALTESHLTSFPISADILNNMTTDLLKIMFHLRLHHSGIPALRSVSNQLAATTALHAPWRYKHTAKQTPKDHKKAGAGNPPPKPSPKGQQKS